MEIAIINTIITCSIIEKESDINVIEVMEGD